MAGCSGHTLLCSLSPSSYGQLSLGQWLSTGALCLAGDRGQTETFLVTTAGRHGGRVASNCVDTRDAAKHPTRHRTAPYNKELPSPRVDSAGAEKPCPVPTATCSLVRGCRWEHGHPYFTEEETGSKEEAACPRMCGKFLQSTNVWVHTLCQIPIDCRTETGTHFFFFFYSFINIHLLCWLLGICSDALDPALGL